MRNAEVIRQWKILKTIEAGRWTSAGALAREHGVTERTIRRDLEALRRRASRCTTTARTARRCGG